MFGASGRSTAGGRGSGVALVVLEPSKKVSHTRMAACLVHDGGSFGRQVAEAGGQQRVLIVADGTGEGRIGARGVGQRIDGGRDAKRGFSASHG